MSKEMFPRKINGFIESSLYIGFQFTESHSISGNISSISTTLLIILCSFDSSPKSIRMNNNPKIAAIMQIFKMLFVFLDTSSDR